MYQDDNFATGYAVGRDSTNGSNSGWGFGGEWAWIIILLLLGWGNRGFGGFGGGFGGGYGVGSFDGGYDIGKLATTNDVAVGFNNSAVLNNLNDLKLGQAGLQQTLCRFGEPLESHIGRQPTKRFCLEL